VGKAIELCDGLSVTCVLHARIPVISIWDSITDTSLDLSMWNVDKMHISEIFAFYFDFDPKIRPLIYTIRKVRFVFFFFFFVIENLFF
jgi:DNA polymerase sigma